MKLTVIWVHNIIFSSMVNGRKSAEGQGPGPNPALTQQFRRAG